MLLKDLHLPVSTHPTGLDECLFFISLVSDFLAVRFSVSSGCARRRSVSTYAAILVHNVLNFNGTGWSGVEGREENADNCN